MPKSNLLAGRRALLDGMQGHNFALPDCLQYLFERTGAFGTLDYWNFAALTGDVCAQVYDRGRADGCEYCVSGYLAGPDYLSRVFGALGYAHTYAGRSDIRRVPDAFARRVAQTVDGGLPVLAVTNLHDIPGWESDVGTYCLVVGYDDGGRTLKLNVSGTDTLDCPLDGGCLDLVFLGERQHEVSEREFLLACLRGLPHWLTLPAVGTKRFGAAAFRAWADDIDEGTLRTTGCRCGKITACTSAVWPRAAASRPTSTASWPEWTPPSGRWSRSAAAFRRCSPQKRRPAAAACCGSNWNRWAAGWIWRRCGRRCATAHGAAAFPQRCGSTQTGWRKRSR